MGELPVKPILRMQTTKKGSPTSLLRQNPVPQRDSDSSCKWQLAGLHNRVSNKWRILRAAHFWKAVSQEYPGLQEIKLNHFPPLSNLLFQVMKSFNSNFGRRFQRHIPSQSAENLLSLDGWFTSILRGGNHRPRQGRALEVVDHVDHCELRLGQFPLISWSSGCNHKVS